MMTEGEAKMKWCPFSRYEVTRNGGGGVNRWRQDAPPEEPHALNPIPCRCIASACMAWRWQPLMADAAYLNAVKQATDEAKASGSNPKLAAEHVNANRAKFGLPEKPFIGFCGLASKP